MIVIVTEVDNGASTHGPITGKCFLFVIYPSMVLLFVNHYKGQR